MVKNVSKFDFFENFLLYKHFWLITTSQIHLQSTEGAAGPAAAAPQIKARSIKRSERSTKEQGGGDTLKHTTLISKVRVINTKPLKIIKKNL